MSSIQLTAEADAKGNVHLDLPTGTPHARIVVNITYEVAEHQRARTKVEHQAFIDKIFGKCDDPTFQPFGDQPVESIDPL